MSNETRIIRNNHIRLAILRTLHAVFAGAPTVYLPADHLYTGLSSGPIQFSQEEIDGQLCDLIDLKFIAWTDLADPASKTREKGYQITRQGRCFVLAGCPWGAVDVYKD